MYRPVNDEQGGCASSKVRGNDGRCASSGVRQSGDPGGGPEPEAKYEPACGKLIGVLDEIQMLDRATRARMPGPAVMRAQEEPGEQMTVATMASVGDQIQKTARLFNPHGSPLITWEGGENESVRKDIRKQSAAQRVPTQLRSSFQPEPRREAICAERTREPVQGKISGPSTIKTRNSIMLEDRELCGDREDAMQNSRRSERQDETADGMRAMPSTNAARGRRRSGQVAGVAEAVMPSPMDEDPPAARYGKLTMSGMSAGATAATADGLVVPLPGEPMPIRAEVRAPHPAELLVLQVPSQWILEVGAATSRDQAQGTAGSVAQYELQPSREEGSRDEPPPRRPMEGR